MTNKTKIIFSLITAITVLTFSIPLVTVATVAQPSLDLTGKLSNVGSAAGFENPQPNLAATVGQIIRGFLSILGIVFMAYIIYAGYQWMMARGNEEQLSKAKAIIRGSIVGLIVVLAAYAITAYVVNRLTLATGYTATETTTQQ